MLFPSGMCSTAAALADIPQKVQRRQNRRHILERTASVCDKEHTEQTTILDLHQQHAGAANTTRDPTSHVRVRKLPSSNRKEPNESKKSPPDKPADYSKDWKKIAEIFDRLFFFLFLGAFVISTLVLFHPLTMPVRQSTHPTAT